MTEEQLKELVRLKRERDDRKEEYDRAAGLQEGVETGMADQVMLRLSGVRGPRKAAAEAYVSTYVSLARKDLDEAEERLASALAKFGDA